MGRPKLQLKLIEKLKQRLLTYRKRKDGLKKKACELSTLCDVPTLVVCVGPTGEVETWPETGNEVQAIVDKFQQCGPAAHSDGKHRMDLVDYLLSQIAKQRSGCKLDDMSEEALGELCRSVDVKMAAVKERMLSMRITDENDAESHQDDSKLIDFDPSMAQSDFQAKAMATDENFSYYAPHEASKQIGYDQGQVGFDKCRGSIPFPSKMDFGSVQLPVDALLQQYHHGAPAALFDARADPVATMPQPPTSQFPTMNGMPQFENVDERVISKCFGENIAAWEDDFSPFEPKLIDPFPCVPPTSMFDAWADPMGAFAPPQVENVFEMLDDLLLTTGYSTGFQSTDMGLVLNGMPPYHLEQGSTSCPEPQQSNMIFCYFPPGLHRHAKF